MRCSHCSIAGHSCYNNRDNEYFSWCLQAQGWHRKKNRWRCPNCHDQLQNCQYVDLGHECVCNGHGVLQHPDELSDYHVFIEECLDVSVARMIEFGFIYRWHHIECNGSYPPSSPTDWCFGSECSRVWSRLDMWRPCHDWTSRRWCEVALHMPRSTSKLRNESARGTTLASWVECLVGLITVIGTEAHFLPEGNRLELVVQNGCQGTTDGRAFMNTVWQIWMDLARIGIPMPQEDCFSRSAYCGLRLLALI